MNMKRIRGGDVAALRGQQASHSQEAMRVVDEVIRQVRQTGDGAVRAFTAQFDGVKEATSLDWSLRVEPEALEAAFKRMPAELKDSLSRARERIHKFHELERPAGFELTGHDAEVTGLLWRPLNRVGVYVPGGRAIYPSSVLMNVIPAQVAGVKDIVLVSPPSPQSSLPNELVLGTAYLLGITQVYRIGGAQAVAALAYGTEQIPRVDKIVGPGNQFVALAKRRVRGDVGIDSVAGPTEIVVVADDSANPRFIAADMLAQAEHDPQARAICIVPSDQLADEVERALSLQLATLPKREIATRALELHGAIVIASDLQEAFSVVNDLAPEHVELLLENPEENLKYIHTAGAVFLGPYTPEPVGDYYAGTNHVLPTFGSARFDSGLGVHDFLRRMCYVRYSEQALRAHQADIVRLAFAEGLEGHARALQIRFGAVEE